MKTPLNLLIVEDVPDDAELLLAELRRAGFAPKWKRVETEQDFLAELKNSPDIILSDYSMPQFTGLRAVELLQESGLGIPFILISGTVGEDVAVEAMRHGATDYLLKDRITRLGIAVERALREAKGRAKHKQAEAAMRESELKFRQIAEAINEVFWITTPQLDGMLYVSPAFENIWGRTCESLYQSPKDWIEAIHPDDRENVHQAALTKMERGDFDETYRIVRPDGSVRWIHDRGFPVRDAAGKIYRIAGVAEDVTERKQADERLRLLRSAIEQSKESILITDAQLDLPGPKIIFVNPAFTQMTGYAAAEAIGKTPRMLQGPRTDRAVLDRLRENLAHGEVFAGETVNYRKGGKEFILEWQIAPIRDAKGTTTHFVAIQRDITERKRTMEKLKENEAGLAEAQRIAKLGSWQFDLASKQVRWSDELCRIFGIGRTQFDGTHEAFLNCIIPDDRPKVLQVNAEATASGTAFELEYRIQTRAGDLKTIREIGCGIKDASGKVVRLFGTAQDITEYKRAEESLFASEQRLNAFFTSAPAGLVLLDQQLRFVQLNETVTQINGVSIEDHLGKTVREILPRLAPVAEPLLQQVLATGESLLNIELSGETPSRPGVLRHWMESFFPVLGKDGRTDGVGVIFVEITEHKRAEEELRWKTTFLEAQVHSSPDGILVVDNQGRKILQNERMNAIWKIPPHIAEDKEDAQQIAFVASQTKDPVQFAAKVTQLYSHPDQVSRDEIELADDRILDRYSSPVRDKAGKYYGRIWTFRDITDQRKLEAQFRQSQKMEAFGQVAGGVAHDFNNLLAVIQLQIDLFRDDSRLTPEQTDSIGEILGASERAAALTRQLLLFSRKNKMQPSELNLDESISNTLKMLRRILGEHIELHFKFATEPLFLYADAGMIDQMVMNLAINARDAMPKGGRLLIETSPADFDETISQQSAQARPGSFVCLSLSDTGCGIPAENLPRIFEPFFTTKEVGKGTGLGLATVFGIVKQHQGWIHVYSHVGLGTTFRIYLPRLTKATISTKEPTQPILSTLRGGNETILLVEDDELVRPAICNTLSRLGYRVLSVSDGAKALEIWQLRRDEIDLMITDLVMPGGVSGLDLGERLLRENPKLKIIYASGYSAEVAGKTLRLEKGVDFLAKPFQAAKLAQTIRTVLDA